MIPSNIPLGFQ